MITYCCNKCKEAIYNDDIEAIEIEPVYIRMLFPQNELDKKFGAITKGYDEFQKCSNNYDYIHLCGECKRDFYDYF